MLVLIIQLYRTNSLVKVSSSQMVMDFVERLLICK